MSSPYHALLKTYWRKDLTPVLRPYLILFALSYLSFGHPVVQRALLVVWLIHVFHVTNRLQQAGARFLQLLYTTSISQLPGILLILFSSWFVLTDNANEWPSGLLEAWYHPFIPLLELFPRGHVGKWSDLYMETCMIPISILVLLGLYWSGLKLWRKYQR